MHPLVELKGGLMGLGLTVIAPVHRVDTCESIYCVGEVFPGDG